MSNPSGSSILVYALFAFLFVGAMFVAAWVFDRRRAKEVKEDIPERVEGSYGNPQDSDPHANEVHTAGEYEQRRRRNP